MKTDNLAIGRLGETIAKRYLQGKGYRIVDVNYRDKYAEIDLIARNKNVLVFIEVKTRKGEQFGSPEESIKRDKMRKLIKNAQAYAAKKRYNKKFRIDVLCIVLDDKRHPSRIDHYENITQ